MNKIYRVQKRFREVGGVLQFLGGGADYRMHGIRSFSVFYWVVWLPF